jgi:hypothetical protein
MLHIYLSIFITSNPNSLKQVVTFPFNLEGKSDIRAVTWLGSACSESEVQICPALKSGPFHADLNSSPHDSGVRMGPGADTD